MVFTLPRQIQRLVQSMPKCFEAVLEWPSTSLRHFMLINWSSASILRIVKCHILLRTAPCVLSTLSFWSLHNTVCLNEVLCSKTTAGTLYLPCGHTPVRLDKWDLSSVSAHDQWCVYQPWENLTILGRGFLGSSTRFIILAFCSFWWCLTIRCQ